MKRIVLVSLALAAFGIGAPGPVAAADKAGEVVFLVGDATVSGAADKSRPLAKGDTVAPGQTLETGKNGHLHLRMVDNAFVSLRPNTRLRIEDYRYDARHSANNRVKFVLEKGVARNITGKAGENNKRNYRLNTPLAAIGIHGTDYVVHVLPAVTRVSVHAGAITMTPFGGDCRADALGPCESAHAATLTAAMRNAYLELRARDTVPVLVPAGRGLDAPNRAVPPHPDEPRATTNGNGQTGKLKPDNSMAEAVNEATTTEVRRTTDTLAATLEAARLNQEIWWGRWEPFVKPDEPHNLVTAQLAPGREIGVVNPVFGIVRSAWVNRELPTGSEVQFRLYRSEAYLNQGGQLSSASVSDPTLTMNFDQRRFATNLTVQHNSLNAPLKLHAEGAIRPYGFFFEDAAASNMRVDGALGPQGKQAGYLFLHDITPGSSAVGATHWVR